MSAPTKIVARMREAVDCKTDVELSRKMRWPTGTIANWKNRESIPMEHLLTFTARHHISLEWLVNGVGPMFKRDLKYDDGNAWKLPTTADPLYPLAGQIVEAAQRLRLKLTGQQMSDLLYFLHRTEISSATHTVSDDQVETTLRIKYDLVPPLLKVAEDPQDYGGKEK